MAHMRRCSSNTPSGRSGCRNSPCPARVALPSTPSALPLSKGISGRSLASAAAASKGLGKRGGARKEVYAAPCQFSTHASRARGRASPLLGEAVRSFADLLRSGPSVYDTPCHTKVPAKRARGNSVPARRGGYSDSAAKGAPRKRDTSSSARCTPARSTAKRSGGASQRGRAAPTVLPLRPAPSLNSACYSPVSCTSRSGSLRSGRTTLHSPSSQANPPLARSAFTTASPAPTQCIEREESPRSSMGGPVAESPLRYLSARSPRAFSHIPPTVHVRPGSACATSPTRNVGESDTADPSPPRVAAPPPARASPAGSPPQWQVLAVASDMNAELLAAQRCDDSDISSSATISDEESDAGDAPDVRRLEDTEDEEDDSPDTSAPHSPIAFANPSRSIGLGHARTNPIHSHTEEIVPRNPLPRELRNAGASTPLADLPENRPPQAFPKGVPKGAPQGMVIEQPVVFHASPQARKPPKRAAQDRHLADFPLLSDALGEYDVYLKKKKKFTKGFIYEDVMHYKLQGAYVRAHRKKRKKKSPAAHDDPPRLDPYILTPTLLSLCLPPRAFADERDGRSPRVGAARPSPRPVSPRPMAHLSPRIVPPRARSMSSAPTKHLVRTPSDFSPFYPLPPRFGRF